MRGSAQLVSGRPAPAALRAAWQGVLRPPCTPDQEGLTLVGSPASDLSGSDTLGPGERPLTTHAQGALLPETPAGTRDISLFLHLLPIRRPRAQ